MQSDLSRWSKNTVDYFGLESEYIKEAGPMWMEHIHPDDRAAYLKDIEAVFSGASTRHSDEGQPLFFAGLMTRLDNQNKYDPLTHLLTSYEMQKYDFSTGSGAILLLGINAFRKINNTNGFLYGNKVLIALSECLEQLAGKEDRVYRLQGDEFIILSPNGSKENLGKLFQKANDYCMNILGLKSFSISAGLVSYPEDGTDFNTLMSNLEHSLEYAKEQKTECIAEFSEKISRRHLRTSRLHEALTQSIHNNFAGFELEDT